MRAFEDIDRVCTIGSKLIVAGRPTYSTFHELRIYDVTLTDSLWNVFMCEYKQQFSKKVFIVNIDKDHILKMINYSYEIFNIRDKGKETMKYFLYPNKMSEYLRSPRLDLFYKKNDKVESVELWNYYS